MMMYQYIKLVCADTEIENRELGISSACSSKKAKEGMLKYEQFYRGSLLKLFENSHSFKQLR